jgi:hypothetical protein
MMKTGNYALGYVASPLNASSEKKIKKNMKKARAYESVLNILTGVRNRAIQGYVPSVLNDKNPEERQMGLDLGIKMLKMSDAIILCGTKITDGMAAELKVALEDGMKIYVLVGTPAPTGFKIINMVLVKTGKIYLEERTQREAEIILLRRKIL